MAFPDIPTPAPGSVPIIAIDAPPVDVPVPASGDIIVEFDTPVHHIRWGSWFNSAERFSASVNGDVPSNSGIYGPNPPVLNGQQYGKVAGPKIGVYAPNYLVGPRSLDTGKYYLVVRPQDGSKLTKLSIGVARSSFPSWFSALDPAAHAASAHPDYVEDGVE